MRTEQSTSYLNLNQKIAHHDHLIANIIEYQRLIHHEIMAIKKRLGIDDVSTQDGTRNVANASMSVQQQSSSRQQQSRQQQTPRTNMSNEDVDITSLQRALGISRNQ